MQLIGVLGRRLLQIAMTVVLVALLMFALMRMLPGDPALMLLGDKATDAMIDQMHHELGLDQSIAVQFWDYLHRTLMLQMGESITMRVPVSELIRDRLPVTLMLTGMAVVMAVVIAIPLAFIGALRQGGWVDMVIRVISQVSLSMPVFYIGLVLLIALAAGLHWFPVGGIGDGFFQDLYYLFLPALTLALSLSAILLRNLRESLIETLGAEYVGFATAKGLSPRLVLGRHVLRNAWISTITLLGLHVGSLVGGAVITETVFAVPGVGRLMIDSIFARDYAVVQGLTVVLAVLVSVVFLAVDTLQAVLGPARRRMSEAAITRTMPALGPVRRRRFRLRAPVVAGLLIVTLFLLCAAVPELIAPYAPNKFDYRALLKPPSAAHWFGTDNFGRDILSRTIWAARIDLQIAIFSTVFPALFGTLVGCLVGYGGGIADAVFRRLVDLIVTVPLLVIVIAIVAVLGPGLINMYIAISLVNWIIYGRLMRAEIQTQKRRDYAAAGRVMGYGAGRIIFRHLLPNAVSPILVYWMTDMALAILLGSSLGYLGLGAQPPTAEWGVLIADGKNFMTTAWWMSIFPGIAIVIAGTGFSLLGDGLAGWLRGRA